MTTKSYFELYNEFADACDIPQGSLIGRANLQAIALAERLVNEEVGETSIALYHYTANPSLENLAGVADGIGDSIYVLCQLARSLGIPLDPVFGYIHTSNMLKVGPDGKVVRREDGKILKPEGWRPPDIWGVLNTHHEIEARKQNALGAEHW